MRKSIVMSLVALLILVLATPVFAANSNLDEEYSSTVEITAITTGSDTYSVDVEWGDMTFNYTAGEWNTTDHKYNTEDSATWIPKTTNSTADALNLGTGYILGSGQVLVRNHSNQPVTTDYIVEDVSVEGFVNVKASVTDGGEIDACPVLGTAGNVNVPYQTAEVTLSGVPTYRDTAVIGNLTIKISK